jgi:hypothetical protein
LTTAKSEKRSLRGFVIVMLARERKEVPKMKKIVLLLAGLLLCGSTKATVEITLEKLSEGVIQIGYDATSETELIRAFALDIVATDGNIIAIGDYAVGENNGGYGIFPGSFAGNITVNPTTGQVDSWVGNPNPYTPVAPAGAPDALGDIPGPAITIEMGSLYTTAAPAKTGVLCTITVDQNVTKVCVTGNAIRGNVVLEDGSEMLIETCNCGDCFPSSFTTYADWAAYGKPDCWCNSANMCGRTPDQLGDYQCDGDCDGKPEGALKYRVFSKDLQCMIEQWKKKINEVTNPCADFDHKPEGALKYRVFSKDLAILVGRWKKKDTDLPGNCGTFARPE